MKKLLSFTLALALMLIPGCSSNNSSSTAESTQSETNSSPESQAENISKPKHDNVVGTIGSSGDMADCAFTLEELSDEADFIAEVKITETSSYVYPNTDIVHTVLTPEVLNIYKGEHNGETLEYCGGYISYNEFMKAPYVTEYITSPFDVSGYTAKELETAEVYYNWCNNYIPEVGDTIIFFGKHSSQGNYRIVYDYQGSFLCENGTVSNQALLSNDNGFTEPLVEDLQKLFAGSAKTATFERQSTVATDVLTIPKTDFTDKLNEIL